MLVPSLPISPKQKILTPEMITDYLVANTPSEKLDTFPLYRPYDQIVNRYHTLKDFTKFQNGVYPEVDLLSSLYTGFNGSSLTQEGLSEINERLAKFPASSLSTKLKNPSLNKLRQKLSKLGLHKEFMSVLSRKYGLKDPIVMGDS